MKTYLLSALLMHHALSPCLAEDTANPVQSYATFHSLTAERIIYKWQVDVNNDAKGDVFLDTKLTPAEIAEENADSKNQYDPDVRGFTVYIAKTDGTGYTMSTGIEEGGELGLGVVPEINITRCFVGQITQLGKRGIVTMKIDNPREGDSVATIYSYTLEGNHLKYTQLAQYTPGQPNAIFDQYLKDNIRTQVQLQEITP